MAFYQSDFMLQTSHHEDDQNHHPPTTSSLPPTLSSCNPQQLHGKRSSMSFSTGIEDQTNNNRGCNDELSDDESQTREKKKRLNTEQVKTLENNFELGNKLEPERKMQLARALGLRPRQIAIWFQNRRARWKTKQLEKDFHLLRKQFEAIKAENDALHLENRILHAQILAMKTKEPTESINLNKETEGSCSNRSENTSELKLDCSRNPAIDSPVLSKFRPDEGTHFFQDTSRPEIQGPKMDQTVKEESLCSMFCGMDDQTGFWPWLEQQNFN
ncbi:hypothetical protein OROMI_022857 [Orobanche minor]